MKIETTFILPLTADEVTQTARAIMSGHPIPANVAMKITSLAEVVQAEGELKKAEDRYKSLFPFVFDDLEEDYPVDEDGG